MNSPKLVRRVFHLGLGALVIAWLVSYPINLRADEPQAPAAVPAEVKPAQTTEVTPAPAADSPVKTTPATTPAATTPATTPATTGQPQVKLTPQQETELRAMFMKSAQMKAQQEEIGLMMSKMQLEKMGLELAAAKRGMMEMAAQDEVNGVYMFCEPVTQDSVKKAMSELNKLSRRGTGPKGEHMALTIVLDSPGGDVLAGLALYDHIRDLSKRGHHMTVKVRGVAASMGGILLQAGDTRIIGENAYVLIHEVGGGTSGKISEMKDQLAFSEQLWNRLVKILSAKSKMKAADIVEKARKTDWWLSAAEAVELGFADKAD